LPNSLYSKLPSPFSPNSKLPNTFTVKWFKSLGTYPLSKLRLAKIDFVSQSSKAKQTAGRPWKGCQDVAGKNLIEILGNFLGGCKEEGFGYVEREEEFA